MPGEIKGKAYAEYRKKRIQKIKKIIVTICIILLVLPTILSIFLMIKVFSMQKTLNELVAQRQEMGSSEHMVQAKGKDGGTVFHAEQGMAVTGSPVAASKSAVEGNDTAAAEKKKIYLTFDDGPGTQTAKILNILKKQKVKATFFVTGKEDEYSGKLYKRIVKEGHTLGMHSYSHIYSDLYSSKKAFKDDFNKLYQLLYKKTGVYPGFYRFPGGSSTSGTEVPIGELISVLEEKGVTYLDWNVVSPDVANASVTKNKMIAGILEGVEAYDTSIVLFYDVADRPMTVKALPEIIKKLKEQNYELLPVDESTARIRHNE